MRAHGTLALVALLASISLTGCGWNNDDPASASAGAVAVIDLDEIARRLGSDKQISAAIAQRQNALSQQLVDLAKSYSAQIEEQKKALPQADAQQSEVTVASWQREANASLNQVKQRAAADLQNHRVQLVAKFRDQIKPVARRVAQQRGLSVIVTKNESMLFDYTAAADITDAVVDELLASAPAPIAAPPAQTSAPAPTAQQAAAPTPPTR
jgi:Skp family chaperone for outer membrane proteins